MAWQAKLYGTGERFGIERIQEIARENGKRGGRPRGSGKRLKGRKAE